MTPEVKGPPQIRAAANLADFNPDHNHPAANDENLLIFKAFSNATCAPDCPIVAAPQWLDSVLQGPETFQLSSPCSTCCGSSEARLIFQASPVFPGSPASALLNLNRCKHKFASSNPKSVAAGAATQTSDLMP
jgi:hypothetical protein